MSEEQNGIKPDQYIIADASDPYIKADADGVVYKHGGIVPHDPNRKPFHFDNALVVPREQFEKYLDQLKDLGSIQKQRMLYGLWVNPNSDRDLKAKAVHDIWAHWMRYMFDTLPQLDLHSGRLSVIPFELAERWKQQMRTDFFALSQREQESDYEVADRYLHDFVLSQPEVESTTHSDAVLNKVEVEQLNEIVGVTLSQLYMKSKTTVAEIDGHIESLQKLRQSVIDRIENGSEE